MTFAYHCPTCSTELLYEFIPGEPVKFTLNHDSPEFSNPGSSDEYYGPERCEHCDEVVDMDDVIEQALDRWNQEVAEHDQDRD
jgi:hypothetical protein